MRSRMMRSVDRALATLVAMDTWNPAFRRTASRTLSCTGLSSTRRTWFKSPSPAPLPGDLAHQKPKNDCRLPQGPKRYAAGRKPLPSLATSPAQESRPPLRAAGTAHRRVCGSSPRQPGRLETRERIRASSSPVALPERHFRSQAGYHSRPREWVCGSVFSAWCHHWLVLLSASYLTPGPKKFATVPPSTTERVRD